MPPEQRREFGSLTLRTSDEPVASIVICVFGEIERTFHCLYAISVAAGDTPYEVIVVDDASPDDTAQVLAGVTGITVVTNEVNRGYLRSANRGMQRARGRYTVLLNNDTAVHAGWLEALVGRAESDPRIGAVGARLIDPDGTLQEAGAILWSDATGWNYGRGWDAEDTRVMVARDVDYCSAAALLVRTSVLSELGGYDERFAPAYYEDADLCLAIHGLGLRVVYEPLAVVEHAEGGTHGTDPAVGPKSHQERNRAVFAAKWAAVLVRQLPMSGANVAFARDHGRPPRALVIEMSMPNVNRDAGSVRLMALIEEMTREGWKVHFHHLDGIVSEPGNTMLHALDVQLLDPAQDLSDQVQALAPHLSLIWVSRPNVATSLLTALADAAPDAALVYDTVDLHFLREQRRAALTPSEVPERPRRVSQEFELAAVRASDLTLTVSDDEATVLRELIPDARVRTVGLVHDMPAAVAPLAGRHDLLFVGGWQHAPNVDAARMLAHDLMPALRARLPGIRLNLAGSHVQPVVRALSEPDIDVLGWLPDLAPVLATARVFVAPLTWGAGVKGKLVQAMAHGVPVVTTPLGAEGLHATDGEHLLVGANLPALIEAVVALATDDALAARLARNGRELALREWSPAAAAKSLKPVLDEALGLAGATVAS